MTRFLFAATLVLVCGCSSGALSTDEATQILRTEIADVEVPIDVKGVSQADGATEAVVEVAVFDRLETVLMGFRHYDTGWKWETVTLPAGRPEPAKTAIDGLRTVARTKRATKWAEAQIDKYQLTADVIEALFGNLSRKPDEPLSVETWKVRYDLTLSALRAGYNPDRTKKLLPLYAPPTDAWGHPIQWVLNSSERSGYIASVGPDGIIDTTDDLACVLQGKLSWDSSYDKQMWDYSPAWRLPEGLASAIAHQLPPHRANATVTYVAHTK